MLDHVGTCQCIASIIRQIPSEAISDYSMDGPPRPVLVRVVNRVVIPVHASWALLLGLLSLASPRLGFSRSPNERGIIH